MCKIFLKSQSNTVNILTFFLEMLLHSEKVNEYKIGYVFSQLYEATGELISLYF